MVAPWLVMQGAFAVAFGVPLPRPDFLRVVEAEVGVAESHATAGVSETVKPSAPLPRFETARSTELGSDCPTKCVAEIGLTGETTSTAVATPTRTSPS